jgi:UDP:flavonoid glycosyltransferase YjiC (YdhE family)
LRPTLPIARAWRDRDHEVVVVSGEAIRAETEGLGFSFIELPRVEGVGDQPFRGTPKEVLGTFFQLAVGWTKPLTQAAEDWKPDVILRETTSWAALFAGDLTGIPVGTFDFNPAPAGALGELLGDQFAEFRCELGLTADPDLAALNRWLTLVGGPPEWFASRHLPPTAHLIQPPDADPRAEESADELLQTLDGRPLVYATLGTTFNAEQGMWPMLLEGLAQVDANVLATVGRDLDPADFAPHPPNVRVERFISQALILPHCSAMLAHGGYGSLMAALRHGVPVVSVPLEALDNRSNAAKLERLGAGIAIHEESRSSRAIGDAVGAVLTKPGYRDSARRLAVSIASLPPTGHGATLLERLADERQPIER